jgi:hypothetical protein
VTALAKVRKEFDLLLGATHSVQADSGPGELPRRLEAISPQSEERD